MRACIAIPHFHEWSGLVDDDDDGGDGGIEHENKKKLSRERESNLNAARKLKESGLLDIIVFVLLVFMIIIAYMIVMCICIESFGIGMEWKWNYCATFTVHKCYRSHPQKQVYYKQSM